MKKYVFNLFLFSLIALFVSLSACSGEVESSGTKTGRVIMTGHEPFARLTLTTDNNEAYYIECEGEVKELLLKYPGGNFILEYSGVKEELNKKILLVKKASLVEHKGAN
ncbi:MAG: hypothetical protein KKA84_04820 [Bacteroidetes bacterium]|nr:hypothetical protein [Bacteroidota bacterium]